MKLKNKIALITGSSSGIGQGVAKLFAQEGATVVVNYPNQEEAENANTTLGLIADVSPRSITHMANVSAENEVIEMVNNVKDAFGTIDILVNNAGIATSAPIHEMTSQMWNELLSIHLNGTFMCTRECLKIMYKNNYGRIINTASQLAYKGSAGSSTIGIKDKVREVPTKTPWLTAASLFRDLMNTALICIIQFIFFPDNIFI